MERSTNNHDLMLLQVIIAVLPKRQNMLKLSLNDERHFTVDLACAKQLQTLLPRLECLYLDVYNWTVDGFLHLLMHLQLNRTIKKIEKLSLPSRHLLTEFPQVGLALQSFLSQNTTLQHLGLEYTATKNTSSVDESHESGLVFLKAIKTGLQGNTSLKYLSVHGLKIPFLKPLLQLLASLSALEEVRISGFQISDDGLNTVDAFSVDAHGASRLQKLVFESSIYLNKTVLWTLPKNLAIFPNLKQLSLTCGKHQEYSNRFPYLSTMRQRQNAAFTSTNPVHDITTTLVSLLQVQISLKTLEIRGLQFDHAAVIEALAANQSTQKFVVDFPPPWRHQKSIFLSYLHLLQHYNATCIHLEIPMPAVIPGLTREDSSELVDKMRFLLKLNQAGRSKARESPSQVIKVVLPLLDSERHLQNRDNSIALSSTMKLSLIYGLLHESPASWAMSQTTQVPKSDNDIILDNTIVFSNRKRKRIQGGGCDMAES